MAYALAATQVLQVISAAAVINGRLIMVTARLPTLVIPLLIVLLQATHLRLQHLLPLCMDINTVAW